jgi:hypothetical protein
MVFDQAVIGSGVIKKNLHLHFSSSGIGGSFEHAHNLFLY